MYFFTFFFVKKVHFSHVQVSDFISGRDTLLSSPEKGPHSGMGRRTSFLEEHFSTIE